MNCITLVKTSLMCMYTVSLDTKLLNPFDAIDSTKAVPDAMASPFVYASACALHSDMRGK